MDHLFEETGARRPVKDTWKQIGAPRSDLSRWVKLADARFTKSFAYLLNDWGIIASELAALRELYRPGRRSPVELGLAIGMSKGGVSKLIDRLVLKGLVTKVVAQYDRRFRAVELTWYGKDVVEILAPAQQSANREFFRLLGAGGRRQLMQSLRKALGPGQKERMEQWLVFNGDVGELMFQGEWWSSVGRRPEEAVFFWPRECVMRFLEDAYPSSH